MTHLRKLPQQPNDDQLPQRLDVSSELRVRSDELEHGLRRADHFEGRKVRLQLAVELSDLGVGESDCSYFLALVKGLVLNHSVRPRSGAK